MKLPKFAKESHKTIIGKFEKQKVHSSFKDNIWGVDLVKHFEIPFLHFYPQQYNVETTTFRG